VSLTQQLKQSIGQPELLKLFVAASEQPATYPTYSEHEESLCAALFQDPDMLHLLLQTTHLLREKPELAVALVEHAYHTATSETIRRHIKTLALKFKLDIAFKRKRTEPRVPFTPLQAELFKRLQRMAEVFFKGNKHQGVSLRLLALLMGPSGCGKTHLAHALADELGVGFCRLTVGDWLVSGSRNEPTTLQTLQKCLDESPRMILFLDELDKFRADDSGWSRSVMTEVFSILDRKVNYRGTTSDPWTQKHSDRLKDGVFIVAAGTWQSVFESQTRSTLGFAGGGVPVFDEHAFKSDVRKCQMIPPELLNRFHEDWLILKSYSPEDFVRIAHDLNLEPGVLDPVAAAASGLNYRAVERAVTNFALRLPVTEHQIPLSIV
jgi:DNA replication protein DnaC